MTAKQALIDIAKLIFCGLMFFFGTMVGGVIAHWLNLPAPLPPQGADMNSIALYLVLTTPLLAFALAVLARHLAGNFWTRMVVLSFFMWVAYTVNTQLEASLVTTYAAGMSYALVMNLVAALFCGAAVALSFPSTHTAKDGISVVKAYFADRGALAWSLRFVLGAVAFMPIYFTFGLMVLPFTGEYYRQSMFGLVMPTIEQLLPILLTRSVLFFLGCLPILMLWQASPRALFWRLGLALFCLVGFVIMLYATWLPLYVRFPHTLEILADEFVYAGLLVLLFKKRAPAMAGAPNRTVRPESQVTRMEVYDESAHKA